MENNETSNQPSRLQRIFSLRTLGRLLIAAVVLVTFGALFFAEEGWRGKRAWEKYRRDAEARGVVMDMAKFIPPPVPDDQNFAMTPFLAPIYDMNPEPLKPGQSRWRDTNAYARIDDFAKDFFKAADSDGVSTNGKLKDLKMLLDHWKNPGEKTLAKYPASAALRKEAALALLEKMEPYQPVMQELREAAKRPYSRFGIKYDTEDPAAILLPYLAKIKRLCRYAAFQGEVELAADKNEEAFQDLQLEFKLCDSMIDEPIIISELVRIAALTITVNDFIIEGIATHKWTDSQLEKIQEHFEGLNMIKEGDHCLQGERVGFGVEFYNYLRKNRSVLKDNGLWNFDGTSTGSPYAAYAYFPSGWLYMEQVNHHRWFDHFATGVEPDFSRLHPKILDEPAEWETNKSSILTHMLIKHDVFEMLLTPALNKYISKCARGQTMVDELVVACAIERNRLAGNPLPEKLESLVPQYLKKVPLDVIGGEPLKYRRVDEKHFLLYGVGWNETDDGGIAARKSGKDAGPDYTKGDWVWPAYPEE